MAPVPRNWGPGKDESSRSENITPDKVAKAPPIRFLGIPGLRLQAKALIQHWLGVVRSITPRKHRSGRESGWADSSPETRMLGDLLLPFLLHSRSRVFRDSLLNRCAAQPQNKAV